MTADDGTVAITSGTKVRRTLFSFRQAQAGPPLSPINGRTGFLFALATFVKVEVRTPYGKETVSAMFWGSSLPLLMKRIGWAQSQSLEVVTAGDTTAGATAVPLLGYMQQGWSQEEERLFVATEEAVAEHWKDRKTLVLPLPPEGVQWDLSGEVGATELAWEAK